MTSAWLIPNRPIDATDVKAYASGLELYPDMLAALRTATGSEHVIYLLGWDVQISDVMPLEKPGGSASTCLREVLRVADSGGVFIRAMYDADQLGGTRSKENNAAVDYINGLKNGSAIIDARVLQFGAHHQKVLIVSGSQGVIAFVGGFDIHPHRWNWVDVHCRLIGGAACQVVELFHERWLDHPFTKKPLLMLKRVQLNRQGPDPGKEVQVVRTYGNPPAHFGLVQGRPFVLGRSVDTYDFAKHGEFTAYQLILGAIKRATEFIYCEDQYLFASKMQGLEDIREVLANRLSSTPRLKFVALINRTENINDEVKQAWSHRQLFIERIRSANPGKVWVFQYKKNEKGESPYVHSKSWIFDDEFAIIGSANCNRRSYSHDSEVAVGIAGQNATGAAFAYDLRVKLWLARLNPGYGKPDTVKPDDVRDWKLGLKLMGDPASLLEPYDVNGGKDNSSSSIVWNNLLDPDGS
jgi:phosphatidylserine/phosphatidylglycerophosphate/cardiolipin synthase-like enzyme